MQKQLQQIAEETRALNEKLRDSNTRTKLEGLKQLIAMMSTGRDVSHFFPSVVVNISSDGVAIDVLINALRQLDSDVVQLEELVVGGVNENWPIEEHPDSVFPAGG